MKTLIVSFLCAAMVAASALIYAVAANGPSSAHQPVDTRTTMDVQQQTRYASHGLEIASKLKSGQFDKVHAEFASQLATALPKEKLEGVWKTIEMQIGPVLGFGDAREEPGQGYTAVYIPIQTPFTPAEIKVVFQADSEKIVGFFIQPPSKPGSSGAV